MLGYVYVITTCNYRSRSVFKIGFTTNLNRRLKLFNATRMNDDLFYCVRNWRTVHYSKLEAYLHAQLNEYRKKNEFFKVSLSTIEEKAEEFAKTNGPQFFYQDLVLIKQETLDVNWIPLKFIFIFKDDRKERGTSRVRHVNEVEMKEVITDWISCAGLDVYGMLKFAHDDVIAKLVELLKLGVSDVTDAEDLSTCFKRLKL